MVIGLWGASAPGEGPKAFNGDLYCDQTGNPESNSFVPPPFWHCNITGNDKAEESGHTSADKESGSRDSFSAMSADLRDWLHRLIYDPIAFCTLGLWVFTALLWSATRKAVSDSAAAVVHAETAAQAATKQANLMEQSLMASERPYVLLNEMSLITSATLVNPLTPDDTEMQSFAFANLQIQNFGRTPAIVQEVVLTLHYVERFDPENTAMTGDNRIRQDEILGEHKKQFIVETNRVFAEPGVGRFNIGGSQGKRVIRFGFIFYKDLTGYIYIRRMFLEMLSNGRVVQVCGDKYNYERRYDPPTLEDKFFSPSS